MMGEKFVKARIESFRRGDIVKGHDGSDHYIILHKGTTFLHNHPYYEVIYLRGAKRKYSIEELKEDGEFREVLRLNMGRQFAPSENDDEVNK